MPITVLKEYSKYKESVENVLYYNKIVPKIKGYNIIHKITDTQIHNCLFLDDYDEPSVASNELILRTTSFQVYQDQVPLRILYQVKAN